VATKYFRIKVKDDDIVLDEKGRRLLGVESVLRYQAKYQSSSSIFIKMKFTVPTSDQNCFTIRPFFEERDCGVVRDSDKSVMSGVSDIIMNENGGYTFTLRKG